MNPKSVADGLPFLHVYPQYSHHSDLRIVGTKAALQAVADACQRAIRDMSARCDAMVIDGEGYVVIVHLANAAGMRALDMPYIADEPKD